MKIENKILVMRANHRNKDILVLTEDFADNVFWKRVLNQVIKDKSLAFPNDERGHTGEGYLNAYKPFVNDKFIICHDSDNKFLWSDKEPNSTPFIYETFVYSIENYSFDPKGINDLIHSMTGVDFDITDFIEKYCEYITDLFYWWSFFKKYGKAHGFSSNDTLKRLTSIDKRNGKFNDYLNLNSEEIKNTNDLDSLLSDVYRNVENYFEQISNEIAKEWLDAINESEIKELKKLFKDNYLIENHDIIYFLQGHSLEDIFMPFFDKLITVFKDEYIQNLGQNVKNDVEGRIRTYKNKFNKDLKTMLSENYKYQLGNPNKFFQKVLEAIKRDFE